METKATIASSETDLIASKAKEYSELPGMILGLDGWILRSVPKELRGQFLTGYLKLLRICFHPDRFERQEQKDSRQNFLQMADEAVTFMLSGEYAFELTADNVPTKKNPLVALRDAINKRDELIELSDTNLDDTKEMLEKSQKDASLYREKFNHVTMLIDSMESHALLARAQLSLRSNVFPVPIRFKRYTVRGHWIDMTNWPDAVMAIVDWAKKRRTPNDIFDRWREVVRTLKGRDETIPFRRGMTPRIKDKKGKVVRDGYFAKAAFTPADIVECIRHSIPAVEITPESVVRKIGELGTGQSGIIETQFTLPFFYSGMMLMLENLDTRSHRLLLVKSVDAGDGPTAALARTLEREKELAETKKKEQREKFLSRIRTLQMQNKILKDLTTTKTVSKTTP